MKIIFVFARALLVLAVSANAASLSPSARAADNALYSRFLCRNRPNGFKTMVPGSCTSYYKCHNGASLQIDCPYYYDGAKNMCVDQNPGCVEDLVEVAPAPKAIDAAPCAGVVNGYVVGNNQAQWYQCLNSAVISSGVCPSGQEYNLVLLQCGVKSSCGGADQPSCSGNVPTTPAPSAVTPTTTSCSTTITTTACAPITTTTTIVRPTTTTTIRAPITTTTTNARPTTTTTIGAPITTTTTTVRPTTTTATRAPITTTTTTATCAPIITTTATVRPTTTTTCAPITTTTTNARPTTTTTIGAPITTTTTAVRPTTTTTIRAPITTTTTNVLPRTTTTTCAPTTPTVTPVACITTTKPPCATTTPPCTTTSCPCTATPCPQSIYIPPYQQAVRPLSVLPPQSHQSNMDLYIKYVCQGKPTGFTLPSLRSCNEYYICRNDHALKVSCGDAYFNAMKGQCDLPENSGCIQPYQQLY
nr:mucin-2 [Bactrocera oleae]